MNTENKSTTFPQYLSSQAIAELFGLSRTSIWRLSQLPNFPPPLRVGRAVRFDVAAVIAFVEAGGAS